jgi:putative phosphoesterase
VRIGLISDIHDNVWALRAALNELQSVGAVLCAGDLCSPFTLHLLAEGYTRGRIHVVFGNNDGDGHRLAATARAFDHVELHGEVYQAKLGRMRVFMNHYPAVAAAVDTSRYDLIVYGHDHRFAVEQDGGAWRINPGTLLGYAPLERTDVDPTLVVVDTVAAQPEAFRLERDAGRYRVRPRPTAASI